MRKIWLAAGVLTWLGCVMWGIWVIWAYDNRPGADAHAPRQWPLQSALVLAPDGPTLVFVAHPQCTCTRASLEELAEVLARSPKPPRTYIVFQIGRAHV